MVFRYAEGRVERMPEWASSGRGSGSRSVTSPRASGRAYFMGNPMFAPEGFGVAATPWQTVQLETQTLTKPSKGPQPGQ